MVMLSGLRVKEWFGFESQQCLLILSLLFSQILFKPKWSEGPAETFAVSYVDNAGFENDIADAGAVG